MVQHVAAQSDPFTAPAPTAISTARVRHRVAVAGTVTDLTVRRWAGGIPALHVTVTDDTGSLVVAFVGRTSVTGVDLGRTVTVAGAVIRHRGRSLVMNPYLWLGGPSARTDEPTRDRTLLSA